MTRAIRPWRLKVWGVAFSTGDARQSPMLIGTLWDDAEKRLLNRRTSEPARALLFCGRAQARDWCRAKMAEWAEHGDPHVRAWRVRPVRVTETARVIA
jgi:hypothetical protein